MRLFGSISLQVSLSLLLAAIQCAASDLQADYQKFQEKFNRETSPVGKTKALIKMSEIDLKGALSEAKARNLEEADKYLTRYIGVVRQASEVLKLSNRNAQKNPTGFKDFEIALSQQLRKLNDLKEYYPYDHQQTIEQAIEVARGAHQEMINAIFGLENSRRSEEKKRDQPKEAK